MKALGCLDYDELLARAAPLLALPELRHLKGKHNQQDHAGLAGFAARLGKAASGQAALDAAPATHTPAPKGHQGDYSGAALEAPDGAGTAKALAQYEGVEYQRINSRLRGGGQSHDKLAWETDEQHKERVEKSKAFRDKEKAFTDPIIADIRQTMAVSALTQDVRVQRAVKHGAEVFGRSAWYGHLDTDAISAEDDPDFSIGDALYERWIAGERPSLVGVKFRNDGFESTTVDDEVAEKFGAVWARHHRESPNFDGEPIIMNMLVPKGTGAVQLSRMVPGEEAELLFEDGLVHEVVADYGIDDKGFRRIDVMVTRGGGDG